MRRGAEIELNRILTRINLASVSRSVFGALLVLLIGAMSLSSRARAQTVSVAGVAFPVDIVSRVGEDQLLVRLGGKETLIQKSQLERFAIEGTLGEPRLAERLELASLLRFAEESFKTGGFDWAGMAFRAVRWRPAVIETDLVESLDVIADGNSLAPGMETLGRTALRPIYEPERFQRVIARLVLAAGGREPAWIRENGVAYVYGAERAIKERLQLELTERLRVRDVESGELLVRFAREVYGADDPIAQTVTARLDRFRNVLKSVNNGDVEALGNLLMTEIADRELSSLVGPLAMEGLHAAASRAFESDDFEGALTILARVDTLKRSQTTHDLTSSVLTRISPRVGSVLQRPEVQNYLDFMARYDEGLGELYRRKLIESIDGLLREQRTSETEPLLDRLRTFSPPPESEIRSILARQARGYYAQGLYVLAERKLAESSSHGFGAAVLRCQLALAQTPSLVIGVFFAVVIALAGLLLFYRRRGGAPRGDGEDPVAPHYGGRGGGPGGASIDSAIEDDDAPRGFVVNELRRLSPSAQEYQNCLATLGLSPNADVRSIKNTYRKLVKGVHPDRSKAHDEAASNRFIELTKTYDRILELRREFGYED